MVQILNEPKFPVIDPQPDTSTIMTAFRGSDWRNLAFATIVTMPFGYAAGRPLLMRPTMYGSMGISAVFGFILGFQKAQARIMGFRENGPEYEKFRLDTAIAEVSTTAAASATDKS